MSRVASKNPAREQIPSLQYSRSDFYRKLSTHRWKALLSFLAVVAGALLYTFLAPRIYESESVFYVRLGRENVKLDPTTTMGHSSVMAIPDSRENEINSVVQILRSRALTEKVVDALGPELILKDADVSAGETNSGNTLAVTVKSTLSLGLAKIGDFVEQIGLSEEISPREEAITRLQKNFSADTFEKSNLLSLSYRAKSPAVAQQVIAQYTTLYLDEHAGLNRTPHAHEFLEEQTARMERELTQSENELKTLKQQTQLASPDSQRELLVTRLNRLEDDLLTTESLATATKSEVDALNEQLKSLDKTQVAAMTSGLDNVAADGMRQILFNLQLQEKKLAEQYTDDHQELKNIRRQIAQSKAILNQEQESRSTVMESPNQSYEELQLTRLKLDASLLSLEAKAGKLRLQLDEVKNQLQTQIDDELQIRTLQRAVELKDISYRKYVENLEQSNIDHALEAEHISNINVIQPANYIEKPISPNLMLNLVAGIIGGLLLAAAVPMVFDSFDHTLRTPEEMEDKLNLPTLASIPQLSRGDLAVTGSNG